MNSGGLTSGPMVLTIGYTASKRRNNSMECCDDVGKSNSGSESHSFLLGTLYFTHVFLG